MAASTEYKAITIAALLVGAALLVFLGILYTQNKFKWQILDPTTKSLQGNASKVTLTYVGQSTGFQVRDVSKIEQFSSFIFSTEPGKAYNTIRSPQGIYNVPLERLPIQHT